ncbi:MAG: thiamine phosphate synthase [Burkholderiales bacterium]|nr:thiamine phosphate synthase [Burkholderiales bacterium]
MSGLYAVTPDEPDTAILTAKMREALAGGARAVQYRNKTASPVLRRAQARALQTVCRQYHVPLIINDHLDLALEIDADGLHLGEEDGSIAIARARLPGRILGVSCYNVLERAAHAEREGADYVAFGSFFASGVKPGAVHAPLELLTQAKQRITLPVVAIGGITAVNAPQLIAAGADATAVISALFTAPDVRASAEEFSRLFPTADREK